MLLILDKLSKFLHFKAILSAILFPCVRNCCFLIIVQVENTRCNKQSTRSDV